MTTFSDSYKNFTNHFLSNIIFLNPFGGTSWWSRFFNVSLPQNISGTSMEPIVFADKVKQNN